LGWVLSSARIYSFQFSSSFSLFVAASFLVSSVRHLFGEPRIWFSPHGVSFFFMWRARVPKAPVSRFFFSCQAQGVGDSLDTIFHFSFRSAIFRWRGGRRGLPICSSLFSRGVDCRAFQLRSNSTFSPFIFSFFPYLSADLRIESDGSWLCWRQSPPISPSSVPLPWKLAYPDPLSFRRP